VTDRVPAVVFLDRDGTIIEDTHFIRRPEDVRLLAGAAEAIAALNEKKIPVVVVTNQSGIARGIISVADYEAVVRRLDDLLAAKGAHVDRSYHCPHHPDVTGPCDCRKPGARLFRDALSDLGLRADDAVYIGDRWRDVAASRELGGRGILVPSPMTYDDDRLKARDAGIETAASLQEAVARLLTLTEGAVSK
jgi:D-glycero-D-manno-heptose 1,7-bisphosphate phosphatase